MSEVQLGLFPHVRFSPSILARLGEELNPNPDHGILELVKNSYDADARHCTIELIDTQEPGGTLRVTDDGDGMDGSSIEDDWLVLGSSSKSIQKPTRLGRLPAGNKGLGRLAALRLGQRVSLLTRPRDEPGKEYQLDIDWADFDNVRVVEEVELEIQKRKRAPKLGAGTVITIDGIRTRITRMDVKRIARGVLLLADPFDDNPIGFRPVLKAPEFKDLEALVKKRYFDDAEFHLVAELDDKGRATAQVIDWRGSILFNCGHEELCPRTADQPYLCPAAHFDLWAFILDGKTFSSRMTTKAEVCEWLGEFGGVHLYVRGLRVAPYGNPGNDWLELNLSRARSPELRPSTNTSIGRITLVDPGEQMVQKTDRTGLMETPAFQELKRFTTDALNWMAKKRLEERERRRAAERSSTPRHVITTKKTVEDTISALPEPVQENVKAAFDEHERARDREVVALRKEVQLYRTLSTVGITAAVLAHESKKPVDLIIQNAKQVRRFAEERLPEKDSEAIEGPVGRILRQAGAIQSFGGLALGQIDHEKRRLSRVDIHRTVKSVLEMFHPFTEGRKVDVVTEFDHGSPYLRASEAAIESIVTNLLANSLRAFGECPPGKRTIIVRTEVTDSLATLRMLDNGPGIQGLGTKDIWLPGETTYPNGTGLGLTIVRDTATDLGGSVDAVATGELGGAEIIVQLPILGA